MREMEEIRARGVMTNMHEWASQIQLPSIPGTGTSSSSLNYVAPRDEPWVYMDDPELKTSMDDLEAARKSIIQLLKLLDKYAEGKKKASKAEAELGKAVAAAVATCHPILERIGNDSENAVSSNGNASNASNAADSSEALLAHLSLSASHVSSSGFLQSYAAEMPLPLVELVDTIQSNYASTIMPLKRAYMAEKEQYVKWKNMVDPNVVSANPPDPALRFDCEEKMDEAKSRWSVISKQLRLAANTLTEAADSGMGHFFEHMANSTEEVHTKLAKNNKAASQSVKA